MNRRRARLSTLSVAAGIFAATLQGAQSGIELSGGPRAKVLGALTSAAPIVAIAPERLVRPLAPGEMLVLGPTAGPQSPAVPAPVSDIPARGATTSPAADTLIVRAPVSAVADAPPDSARAAVASKSWERFRTGDVVRINLAGN